MTVGDTMIQRKKKLNSADALDPTECKQISDYLLTKFSNPIYQHIWVFGLNVPLRISDLLALKFSDKINLLDENGTPSEWIRLKEQKTGKYNLIKLNAVSSKIITVRKSRHPKDLYLFNCPLRRYKNKPISRTSVYRAFAEAGTRFGKNVSCHSTRKSRGKLLYENGVPLERIAKLLNHSSTATTMLYIGLDQKSVNDTYSITMLDV